MRARRLLFVGVWLVIWQLVSSFIDSDLVLPGPLAVCARLGELAVTPKFWLGAVSTLGHASIGYMCAFLSALVCGAMSVRWPVVGDFLQPALSVIKSAPIVCVIVILLLWVGSYGVSSIAAFIVAFPVTYYSAREGLLDVDERMSEMLSTFRVDGLRHALVLVWPTVVPYLAAASEAGCSMAFKATVAAEIVGTPLGSVGERIYQAKLLLETADVLAWTLATVFLATMLTHVFVLLIRESARLSLRLAVMLSQRLRPPAVGPEGVELVDVSTSYDGRPVLTGVTLRCAPGSKTVITDASGAGKTTLLRIVLGLKAIDAGSLVTPVASAVFQETRLIEGLSALDNVTLATGASPSQARSALERVLPGVDLRLPVRSLSGGQRRRVELVRAVLAPSGALVLDEPFASLDESSRAMCCAFVLECLGGRTLVVASHDEGDARLLGADELELFGAARSLGSASVVR